jgi:ribosomal protein S18 acetylase RimI-like enzyme
MMQVGLDVNDHNEKAMSLYKKTGFRIVEKYLTYEKTV